MTDREKLIELLQNSPADIMGNHGIGALADHLIANGVTIPVCCKDCKHWVHMGDGMGDCTNGRFHIDGQADPTMDMNDFCSCGERKDND